MPKITFVNEHRVVEVESGRDVRSVACEANVALDVGRFSSAWSCGGHGLCRSCLCWVEESAPGAAGPRSTLEKMRGLKGWRRLACRTRVTGDVRVFTIAAAGNRVGVAREIAPPPQPTLDPTAPRKPADAASTAEHVKGHPSAIGRGAAAGGDAMKADARAAVETEAKGEPDAS